MVRSSDMSLRAAWEQRLQRFERWAGTVKQFCAKERVSVASLYQWRRKLHSNRSPSHADGQHGRPRGTSNMPQTGAAFVPVQVVGSAVVEVCLAGGARLSIPVDATDALSTVVRALSAETTAASQDSRGHAC